MKKVKINVRMSQILFSLILLVLLCVLISASIDDKYQNMNSDMKDIFQSTLDSAILKHDLVGIQVSIRTSDNVKWNGASGYSDTKKKSLVSSDNTLRIGSITKTFVATTILKLAEENKIDLDESIAKWVPDIANSRSITVRMLLNQTSGIENYWYSSISLVRTLLGKNWKSEELIKIIAKQIPNSEPGKSFYYSNSNYVLLAYIIEKITEQPIHDILGSKIFSKCDLNNTYFLPQDKSPETLIVGYDDEYVPWLGYYKLKPENNSWPSFAYGAGAMVSNTSDLITFIDSLFYGSVVSEKTLSEMQIYDDNLQTTNDAIPGQISYGLGLARFEIGNDFLWGHMGGMMGFESIVLHCKEKNYSIAIIGNLSICQVARIVEEFQFVIQKFDTPQTSNVIKIK